ncbi:uncharacterized protein PV09_03192 [Verruconis gallopava]|uniref:Heme peroxidase n=1 Tax=Verruconis gallopava TaxID=253628 RepID=A0A0D1XTI9_9PEZI|nr:uncharacterized protein PV09_03192 [Verruconis gallopava]KIW06011.1 hypothetical protein PV09_03192 [Verruconis gallopava]
MAIISQSSEILRRAIIFSAFLPITLAFYFVTFAADVVFGESTMPSQLRSIIGTIRKKPTSAADGRSEEVLSGGGQVKKTSIAHDVRTLGLKNTRTVAEAITTLASGEPLDDKELLLEHGVSMLQSMPLNSGLSEKISDGFISMLWNDLPHPVVTYSGPTARYRRHDGGNNNPNNPEMGKAGMPYARNVPPTKPKGPNLPDVEAVYESLLRRDGPFKPHPSGLNRLFFSFATMVIHECFQTSRTDHWINETSSYVDLSTLYGNTEKEQPRVRTYKNGLIYPDSIASERIMMMPPGVIAICLLFSRNHNTIAADLLSINEQGKYKPWDELDEKGQKEQDEDIFQLARNINVGFFASVVLRDYVSAILNTPRANSEWNLALGKEIKQMGKRVERGNGNVVSVEFCVLYHWHAALSNADAKWMEDIIHKHFPDLEDIEALTPKMFYELLMKEGHELMTTKPKDWTFGGLKRGANGSFNNDDLAKIIKDCIEEPAHAFGAHGTPKSLKMVDILGQLQAREHFNVCTLNEFRNYLNLKSYESFEEWNEDPAVARAAELLYGHIDNLELYPGLMAECTKPAMPGSGVCPGQTTGRGILDDAVALVRGDRFLSYDFNSNTLTQWGAAKLQNAAHGGAYGGVLPNLLFAALPGEWSGTGTYGLLPFYTPEAAKGIVMGNKVADKYEFGRPSNDLDLVSIQTSAGCRAVLQDRDSFRVMPQPVVRPTVDPSCLNPKILFESNFEQSASAFFSATVKKLIQKHSLHFRKKNQIDIVRDVTNIAPILWLADRFALPLKTSEHPKGVLTIYETFTAYMIIFMYQHLDITPQARWQLREGATTAAGPLRSIFEAHLKTQVGNGIKEGIVDWLAKGSAFEVGPNADRLYHALRDTKRSVKDLATDCISLGTPVIGYLTQQASLLIDLFLSPGYEAYKDRIIQLAHMSPAESETELQGFVYEGMRHASAVPGIARVAAKGTVVVDGERGQVPIKAGNTVLAATSKAALDPTVFPEPEKLNPFRPRGDYAILTAGMHSGFGEKLAGPALAATLREVFKLKGLRRAQGKLGKFSIVEKDLSGVKVRYYLDASSRENPIPTSLTLEYDPEINGVHTNNAPVKSGSMY